MTEQVKVNVICANCGAEGQALSVTPGNFDYKCGRCSYLGGGYIRCWDHCKDGDLHPRCTYGYDAAMANCPKCGCPH
jgi:hypothetical protein